MGFGSMINDMLTGRVGAWRANHNPVVTELVTRVNELPDPLRTINQGLLFAATETVCWLFGAENDAREGRFDPLNVTANQFRRIYAALLTYNVHVFTFVRRTDDIAAGSRLLLTTITGERETVETLAAQLEDVPMDGDAPDSLAMSGRVFKVIRNTLNLEPDFLQLVRFAEYSNGMLVAAGEHIADELEEGKGG